MDEKQIYNQISLKAARTDKGYTQEALALKLGIAPKNHFRMGKQQSSNQAIVLIRNCLCFKNRCRLDKDLIFLLCTAL